MQPWNGQKNKPTADLMNKFLGYAETAAQRVRLSAKCRDSAYQWLVFDQGSSYHDLEDPDKQMNLPKSTFASAMEVAVYNDLMDLGGLDAVPDLGELNGERCMVGQLIGPVCETAPRFLSFFENEIGVVDEWWYLLRQVVPIVYAFGLGFCCSEDNASMEDTDLLRRICHDLRVDFDRTQKALDNKLEFAPRILMPMGRVKQSQRKSRRSSKPADPAKHKKTLPPKTQGRHLNGLNAKVFDEVVWKCLVSLGWRLEIGTRPRDFSFFPPGVERRRGFSNRTDFF
mmetsp:Transcript_7558/g.17316  ORF Transcript_7558/g.17316 Transcript_7558/m.17316 type:complete len:284 (-) Transcript_7558:651-1502(-)